MPGVLKSTRRLSGETGCTPLLSLWRSRVEPGPSRIPSLRRKDCTIECRDQTGVGREPRRHSLSASWRAWRRSFRTSMSALSVNPFVVPRSSLENQSIRVSLLYRMPPSRSIRMVSSRRFACILTNIRSSAFPQRTTRDRRSRFIARMLTKTRRLGATAHRACGGYQFVHPNGTPRSARIIPRCP